MYAGFTVGIYSLQGGSAYGDSAKEYQITTGNTLAFQPAIGGRILRLGGFDMLVEGNYKWLAFDGVQYRTPDGKQPSGAYPTQRRIDLSEWRLMLVFEFNGNS